MSPLVHGNKTIAVQSGKTLFDYARGVSIRVPSSCNRSGECHECIVEVGKGGEALSARTEAEIFLKNRSYRLACQARIENPDSEISFNVLRRELSILSSGIVQTDKQLNPLTRNKNGGVVFEKGEIWRDLGKYTGRILGISADIGATSIALQLIDLETGELLYVSSFENPQRFGGSDILRRIGYEASENAGELQTVTIAALNFEIGEMVKALKIRRRQICEMVIVGNAAMRDLFFGIDVQPIGVKPYRSVTESEMMAGKRETTALETTAEELGIRIHPKANIYGAPLIGCHVGADATGCILAVGMDRSEKPCMLLDAGTNTEVIVGNAERMLVASCPAGPAFEGGQVTYAMPGYKGAISGFEFTESGSKYEVVGGGSPEGICGSGLIDLLAELRRTGKMDPLGRFEDNQSEFMFEPSKGFSLSRADVSALAQAKSANYCGQSIVLRKYGLPSESYDKLYLAGGFANYVSSKNAIAIGFIVQFPMEKIVKVGNAALEGATMMLMSGECRARGEEFVKRIEHVELETAPDFFEHFVDGCHFDPIKWSNMGQEDKKEGSSDG